MKKNFYLFIALLILSCASSETLTPKTDDNTIPADDIVSNTDNTQPVNTEHSGLDINKFRSSLSDSYTSKKNDIPPAFERIKVEKEDSEEERDLFQGYRVQIYSGQNVALADTAATHFRAWSDTTIVGYQAKTYTFFKAPYYRVHVGDFHDRAKAIEYSNILKRRFRDSWVVYDRVNPWMVPADTVVITTK